MPIVNGKQVADQHQQVLMRKTANLLSQSLAYRGVSGIVIDVDASGYHIQGESLGQSTGGIEKWYERRTGKKWNG